jgi:two-component system sensor histidine kinase AtoS
MLAEVSRPVTSPSRKIVNLSIPEVQVLLDLSFEAVVLVDTRDNRILLANSRTTELTAFTRAELTGLDLATLLPNLDQEIPWKGSVLGQSWDLPLVRHGGTKTDVQFSPTFLDAQKRLAVINLLPVAYREQHQAEQQRQLLRWKALQNLVQASQQSDINHALNQALQAGSDLTGAPMLALYQVDSGTPTFQRTLALDPAERLPVSISPHDLIVLHTPTTWMAGKRPTCDLHRTTRANGITYTSSVPIGDPQAIIGLIIAAGETTPVPGEILPALGVVADHIGSIIQQQAVSNSLREQVQSQQRQLKIGNALRDAVQDGIILVSSEFTILEMNPSAEEMLGYTNQEVIEHPIDNILVCDGKLISSLEIARCSYAICDIGNLTLFRRDGRAFPAQAHALPLWGEMHLEGLAIILEDLSQEEQFRVRTQQLEQRALLGDVTAVFAHEVRNPINNISTGLQLMAMNLPTSDPNQELINRLQQDCDRLADLMKSVLAFARPVEPNKMEKVDMGVLVKRLRERWRPHMTRVHVECPEPDIDPNAQPILGDIRGLEQVLTNLISNAIQAMSETGGTLILKVRPTTDDNNQTEILVSDSGPGIPDDVREHIFEPFYTTKRGGTGLGLSITKQIVTAHKGTIVVTSVPGGTAFQVKFPALCSQN